MIIPPLLKIGDKIGIVAPARKVSKFQIVDAVKKLETWGLRVSLGNNLFNNTHSYLSGSDVERLSDLQSMIDDADVKAILCARGGYGSTRIVDELDFSGLQNTPKWIIGFSDITAIQLKLLKLNVCSIHATMPILFPKYDSVSSVNSLKNLLMLGTSAIEFKAAIGNRLGQAAGSIVGGNLSLILDSLATASEINTTDKILVIEEIDEPFYKIDRMVTQLKRAGKFKTLKALLVGHMTDIKESELPFNQSISTIILNAVKEYDFPVGFGFPSGHENPNLAWVQGGSYELEVGMEKTTLSLRSNS